MINTKLFNHPTANAQQVSDDTKNDEDVGQFEVIRTPVTGYSFSDNGDVTRVNMTGYSFVRPETLPAYKKD